MNVLFYSSYHFNTETSGPFFENIQKHINQGDLVKIVACQGELSSCQVNPNHGFLKCRTCVSTFQNALNCLTGTFTVLTLEDILSLKDLEKNIPAFTYSDIEEFRNLYHESFDIGMAVFSSIVSMTRNPKPDLVKYKSLIGKQILASLHVYEAIKKVIQDSNIDLTYVFNARFATLRACLRACEHVNVDCNVLEEGRDRSTYSVFPNTMPHSFEFYTKLINETWENGHEDKELIALSYFNDRSQSKNERVGHFTKHQDQEKLPARWNPNHTNIVFFTSSEDEFVAIGKDWDKSVYKDQATAIQTIAQSLIELPTYNIYVRMHPNLKGLYNYSIIDVIKIKQNNVEIILPDSDVSSYNLLKNADIIITAGSSMGLEATVFNKPSILTGSSLYMNLNCTYNPATHEELISIILSKPKAKPKEGALKYGYMLKHFGIPYIHYQRIDTFEGLINGRKYGPSLLYLAIRKIGRFIAQKKDKYHKISNNKKVKQLFHAIHGTKK